jgi:hypothetical protein
MPTQVRGRERGVGDVQQTRRGGAGVSQSARADLRVCKMGSRRSSRTSKLTVGTVFMLLLPWDPVEADRMREKDGGGRGGGRCCRTAAHLKLDERIEKNVRRLRRTAAGCGPS